MVCKSQDRGEPARTDAIETSYNQYVTKRLSEKFQRHNITVLAIATLEKRDRKVNALVTLV